MEISVIIPIYNAAQFLEESVNSTLIQDQVKEVILIEDASTDDSLNIAKKLARQDARVKLFQHPDQKNHGVSASRNLGIQKAKTALIAFLDADDIYLPNRFEITQQQFNRYPDAMGIYEAIGTQYANTEAKTIFLNKVKGRELTTIADNIPPNQLFETLLLGKKGWWSLDGFTIKRALIQKIGDFDEQLAQGEDTDFLLRASLEEHLYPGQLTIPIAKRRIHGANSIFDRHAALQSKGQFYQKWFKKMLTANWSNSCNRFLLTTHLSYHPWVRSQQQHWIRRLMKLVLAPGYLIRYPVLFRKLF